MRKLLFLPVVFLSIQFAGALNLVLPNKAKIESYLTQAARKTVYVPDIKLDSVIQDSAGLRLYANINLSYIRFDNQTVNDIYRNVRPLLPPYLANSPFKIITDTQPIEFFVTSERAPSDFFANPKVTPIVENLSRPFIPSKGLFNAHLALWQSHGMYYSQASQRWEFQRAKLFQTVEDLFTQSFVLPFLTPMLENAGAYVFIPRERDIRSEEVIVDNDESSNKSEYIEQNKVQIWKNGVDSGFANKQSLYLDKENPFRMGTYREIETTDDNLSASSCEWIPDVPEKGKYAVYISYKSLPNSTKDAIYTVYHLGGQTKFSVNQQMGGGTWIFLGSFLFDKGKNSHCKVALTNFSSEKGKILTSDALKIGGGMGNISRKPMIKPTTLADTISTTPAPVVAAQASHFPRFVEGARYWLQWAGAPDSVYSRTKGADDYSDDFQSRGFWVNYLAGGSSVLPNSKGLNVPIDLAMAFHSDAGSVPGDSIVGTLGICMTQFNNQRFENGQTRWVSRDLAEYILNEVVADVRTKFDPKWTRRQLWNRSYSEARVPNVPTMLLELLSHQNFADMRYGLDPNFRFTVSRSIYKGMLKFLAQQHQTDYVVQPLPVTAFYTKFCSKDSVRLSWKPVNDPSEPTARPTKYIVYTRKDNGGFDNGQIVNINTLSLKIEKDQIYSFKVTAVNDGGESFPSETLSVCKKSNEKGIVLIINGFDRISAPDSYDIAQENNAGFADYVDHGVPYINEYNYVGPQTEFNRKAPFRNNESPGFGASASNFIGKIIAGNTFDYPYLHGKSIALAGYSFVSSSRDAVANGSVSINKFAVVDIILGKQKQTKSGRGFFHAKYKTFPSDFQKKIADYCTKGGNILVSGAYIGSDLWKNGMPQTADIRFATKILKYKLEKGRASNKGEVETVFPGDTNQKQLFTFNQQLNDTILAIESPDAISPTDMRAITFMKYSENGLGAGVFYNGSYKSCVLGFPIEAVSEEVKRNELMRRLLEMMR
ncbi:MAG: xanthan lyase [Bacteroidales bacterium 45-6]|nr:MAG: xanthan lyase [Bacteroidales bacterium 45-6]